MRFWSSGAAVAGFARVFPGLSVRCADRWQVLGIALKRKACGNQLLAQIARRDLLGRDVIVEPDTLVAAG